MKLMIASDIHGSAHWCRRLLEAWDREGADRLVLLGDILYHGPRNALPEEYAPMEVAAMLNERAGRIFAVRGNCDAEIDQMVLEFPIMADFAELWAENERSGRIFGVRGNCDAEIDQMVLRFPMMADYSLLFSGRHAVFVTHGHLWNREALPQLLAGDVLLHGHTHLPCREETPEGIYIFNPGSVSIPKEGSARGYILLEDREWIWKDLDSAAYQRLTLS